MRRLDDAVADLQSLPGVAGLELQLMPLCRVRPAPHDHVRGNLNLEEEVLDDEGVVEVELEDERRVGDADLIENRNLKKLVERRATVNADLRAEVAVLSDERRPQSDVA